MLLGARRVEGVESGPTGPRVVLRCFCDTVLVWSAASERAHHLPVPRREPLSVARGC
ncbi:hypothetical protein BH10ACT1_BH10ACT1_31530 [soil metagenome]